MPTQDEINKLLTDETAELSYEESEQYRNSRVFREGNLLFTLMHSGWRKGQEQLRNRSMVRVEFDREVPEAEREEVTRMYESTSRLYSLMSQIMQDLPNKRDWLDPTIEEEAKMILGYIEEPKLQEKEKSQKGKLYNRKW